MEDLKVAEKPAGKVLQTFNINSNKKKIVLLILRILFFLKHKKVTNQKAGSKATIW